MDLKKFKTIFDIELNKEISQNLEFSNKYISSPEIKKILNYIFDFVGGGGKRIRPYLCYLSYVAFGGKNIDEIIKIGIGLEFWHGFALVHDDIMDEANKRRGILTFHKFVQKNTNIKAKHIGISQAILVGDLLFARTNKLIFQNNIFDNKKYYDLFNQMCQETIYGQMIDVNLTISQNSDFDEILQKNFLKTSNYSFIKPMQIGAVLAGANDNVLSDLQSLGTSLGQAFQIRDDLKDIVLDTKNSNKSRFNDIAEGAKTIFTNYIFQNGTKNQKDYLNQCLGKKLKKDEISNLQEIFEDTGAIKYGFDLINQNLDDSKKILDKIKFTDSEFKIYFESIISMLSKI